MRFSLDVRTYVWSKFGEMARSGLECLSILISWSRLGIPGQYDAELFHSTVARIADAAEKSSSCGRKVLVGLGGLELRPDVLEVLVRKHTCIR